MLFLLEKFAINRLSQVLLLVSSLSIFLPLATRATQNVTLGWEQSTDTNVVGYNIYYGTVSQVYTNKVSAGNATTATITGLVEGVTYYFAGTTYDALNRESGFSQELSYTVPAANTNLPPGIAGMVAANTAVAGQNVTFSITAAGTGPFTYQWVYNQNPLPAATNAVLTLNHITAAQAGTYSVTVVNRLGFTNSSPVNLTVYPTTAATLTAAPLVSGQFALNVSGVSNYQYVVQASTNLVDWVSVGTNTAPFTFVDASASQFSQRFYRSYYLSGLPANPAADVTNGLVTYYPLAANGNEAVAGNNLTLVGAPAFSSGAINWNGAVPTLGYGSPQQWPQSGLTVSAWINMADPTANYSVAACYGNYSGSMSSAYMQFFSYTNGLTARIVQNTDVNYIGRSTAAILTAGWHFVAFTWSGGTTSSSISVYLDGTQMDNADANGGTFTGAYSGSDVPLAVGAQLSDGRGIYGNFSGRQKGVRLYGRALSGAEIGTLYTNGLSGGIY